MIKKTFDKFPLGFWGHYHGYNMPDESHVKDWHDCGMTLTMSPSYNDKNEMLKFMDLCHKYDIKLILCDARIGWRKYKENPVRYLEDFREFAKDYASHPSAFGCFIGDEPSGGDVDICIEAYKLMLREAPQLTPYLNFLPYWEGQDYSPILSGKSFEEWSDDFIRRSGCKLLSYDCYSQMNPNGEGDEMFFKNLNRFSLASKRNNIPFLSIMLSVGHFRYRVPSIDDFRWQMNCAIACGASAIFWFTYYTPERRNYRGGPISLSGEKNPSYYALKDVQFHFNKFHADIINNSEHIKTYFYGKTYGDFPIYVEGESAIEDGILSISSENGLPAILSLFEGHGKYEGNRYVMIMNNSNRESDWFHIKVKTEFKGFYLSRSTGEENFELSHWDAQFSKNENYTDCGVALAPGQFELFRFE